MKNQNIKQQASLNIYHIIVLYEVQSSYQGVHTIAS